MKTENRSPVGGAVKYRWSVFSIALSVIGLVVTYLAVMYLRGWGDLDPGSSADRFLGLLDGSVVLGAFVSAVIALFKESSPRYGLIALGVSLLNVFFYAR